jgi:predicted GNAT family N-acyltransferase
MNPTAIVKPPLVTERTQFVFREVRTEAELRDVLALRYQVYCETPGLKGLGSLDPTTGLDMDAYDLVSHHFALFARDGARETVVGTLRIAGKQIGPLSRALGEIAVGHHSLESRLASARLAPLPMLSHLEQAPAVRAVHDACVARGERVAEAGRLAVRPELRMAAARMGLRLSHFIVTGALAVGSYLLRLDRVFVDCDAAIGSFYRRFGFEPLPGGEATYNAQFGIAFSVFEATPATVPAVLRPEVERLAQQFAADGEATLSPTILPARAMRGPVPVPTVPPAVTPAAA